MGVKGLRNAAIVAFILSMAALLVGGYFAMEKIPPVPEKVVSGENLLTDHTSIMQGQDVYQHYGLMDHGSVWGHGTLRGMDFSADTLHKIGQHMRDFMAAGNQPRAGAMTDCLPSAAGRSMPTCAMKSTLTATTPMRKRSNLPLPRPMR